MEAAVPRILIVDNDPATAELLRTDLARAGHAVTIVEQADAALAAVSGDAADLVLLGINRPGLNSPELLPRLKAARPALPVLAVGAADATPADFARALELGADEYLHAPHHPTIVNARVSSMLERRKLRVGADEGQQKLQQLSHLLQDVILPLGVALSTERNTDRLLERILLEAKKLCHADAGTLYIRTRDDRLKFSIMLTDSLGIALGGTTGKEISLPPLRLYDADTGAPNHRNIASHVALHGHSVNIPDIYSSEAFDFRGTREFDKRNNYRSISTLTVPLKDNTERVVAVMQLLNALDPITGTVIAFDSYQQMVVESLASQAAVVFNNQLLLRRQEELLKFERDLQIGREIQKGFLPETLPTPNGWQVSARFMPAREVAGDWYDAFMLGSDTMGFVVADVCDKGVGPALFMALVRSLIRVYAQQRYAVLAAEMHGTSAGSLEAAQNLPSAGEVAGAAIHQAVTLANEYIGANHFNMNMFATTFAGVLNLDTGAIVYANAGHNAPILVTTTGSTVRLPSSSPAVGMFPGVEYPIGHAHLNAGDMLVVFSDGIPDARDPHDRFFTEERLQRMVEQNREMPAEQLATEIQETLQAHIATALQFDDITLLVIRRE